MIVPAFISCRFKRRWINHGCLLMALCLLCLMMSLWVVRVKQATSNDSQTNLPLSKAATSLPRFAMTIKQVSRQTDTANELARRFLNTASSPKIEYTTQVGIKSADDKPFVVNATTVLNTMYSRIDATNKKKVQEARQNIASRPLLNPHNFGYAHNVPEACKQRTVTLLIAVPCKQNSFHQRQTIRQTWGQYATDPDYKTVLLFFLGSTSDKKLQIKVDEEAKKYNDLVQETFLDTYRNLSLKSVAIMRWASVYCPDSTFLLKADDDVYVNVPRLLRNIQIPYDNGSQLFITGFLCPVSRVRRDEGSKWRVSREEYDKDWIPQYVAGPAYVMTTVTAMRLYVESLYTKLYPMEDVYLTGICAQQANIDRLEVPGFPLKWNSSLLLSPCVLRQHAADHRVSTGMMKQVYELLRPLDVESDNQCDGA